MPIRVNFIIKINLIHCFFIIKAAADKLKRELEEFGFPPKFPSDPAEALEEKKLTSKESESSNVDNKAKSKKVHLTFENIWNKMLILN